jgi:3-oxoacyl-[acyl-carrier protein] reductase
MCMKIIDGKSALVTGAASGIGRAIAMELARERVDLFLVDLDQAGLAETAEAAAKHHDQVVGHVADLTRPADLQGIVDRLLSRWGGVDILVNNAGVAFYGSTHQMTDSQWQRVLAVNLLAPIELSRKLLPSLLDRPEAHILNVCSIAGLVAAPRLAAYHATKFGLVGFSESLRAEYGPRGLGVTALCPGFVRTNIYRAAMTADRPAPTLPAWCTVSPEYVAKRAVRAIRRVEGVVVLTAMANVSWRLKRFAPGFVDFMHQFRWRRRKPVPVAPARLRLVDGEGRSDLAIHAPVRKLAAGAPDSYDWSPHIIPFSAASIEQRRAA